MADCYENIKRYVDYTQETSSNYLTSWGLGDWVPVKSKASIELTSSIYYYVDATILAKTAKILQNDSDYQKYSVLAEKIAAAINAKYLDYQTGIYANGLQTELSAPLYWGIVPENMKSKVAENLSIRVIADGKHLDVGLLGTKCILSALSENGYPNLAYELASQKSYPSWGWWIENGATTLHENWPLDAKSDQSLNHIMFGEISAWYYKALGGLRPDEKNPGFKNILLEPHFVNGLDSFQASHDGPYGQITSSWQRKGKMVTYHVIIPANSTAMIKLSGKKIRMNGKKVDLQANNTSYSIKLSAGAFDFEIIQ